MSSGNPTGFLGSYFILKDLRNVVDITDSLDDVDLNLMGGTANSDIATYLFPVADLLPLTGDLLTMAQNAALYRVAALWKAKKGNFELARFYDSQFKTNMENCVTLLRATRNTRTKRVSVQQGYKTHITYAQQRKF